MLIEAQRLRAAGQDVVVGIVETHGRAETSALLENLERLALKDVPYRGRELKEFDLEAALSRRPAILLVDELAHSNVSGSRHPKRWQDVQELLAVGIDVLTTINVQHLESLNNVIGEVTGVRVSETVPDRVVDDADEIILVDLPPDDLLRRLKEGKVYLPETIERASEHFFRKGNLIALREMAVRRMADRMDEQVRRFRRAVQPAEVWQTEDALLASVSHTGGDDKVVRVTARLANKLGARWHAVYVETPARERMRDDQRAAVLKTLKLAQDLGAETATVSGPDAAGALIGYAREHNLGRIVVGQSPPRTRWFGAATFAEKLAARAHEIDIITVAPGKAVRAPVAWRIGWRRAAESPLQHPAGYLAAAFACLGITAISAPLLDFLGLTNIAMLFLLGVVLIASAFERGPAVFMTLASVAAFDFFFVPPRFTFAVSDVIYLVTFAAMLIVGLVIGQLTANLRYQIRVARQRERRIRTTYELARALSSALTTTQIEGVMRTALDASFDARSTLFVPGSDEKLRPAGDSLELSPSFDPAIAQWCYDKAEPAGMGTDTLTGSEQIYLPVLGPLRIRGVLVVQPRSDIVLAVPEQRQLLETFTALVANALERVHFVEVAQESLLKMESERLRNSLLSALSHDIRTPLAALAGLCENLARDLESEHSGHAATATLLRAQALRMNQMFNNLLEMARLQSGVAPPDKDWQSIEELVGAALNSLRTLARDRDVRLDIPADLPLVRCDANLIERLLFNLLENALKYCPPDKPIGVNVRAHSDYIEIEVWDEGPGLPKGRESAIFDKFVRAAKESSIAGIGLGLAICKTIVEVHDGTIRAENRTGGGASFLVTLPLEPQPALDPSSMPA
jgi:two-component system sensor histidine kinase KdpD